MNTAHKRKTTLHCSPVYPMSINAVFKILFIVFHIRTSSFFIEKKNTESY